MHQIKIENARFFAKHGYFEEENLAGGHFEINLCIETDFSLSMQSDDLEGTVDYAAVFAICKEEMAIPSKLLEHVAQRILNRLKEKFNTIAKIRLQISKLNPPISGEIEKVSILIEE